MKTIVLNNGFTATVDDEDFEWLSQWRWRAKPSKYRGMPYTWYVVHWASPNGTVYMHREIARIAGWSMNSDYDHVDGNGLNNQRSNLRACSQTQNNGNRRKQKGCTSRFKGVYWNIRKKLG